jgi:hypothetical protein
MAHMLDLHFIWYCLLLMYSSFSYHLSRNQCELRGDKYAPLGSSDPAVSYPRCPPWASSRSRPSYLFYSPRLPSQDHEVCIKLGYQRRVPLILQLVSLIARILALDCGGCILVDHLVVGDL